MKIAELFEKAKDTKIVVQNLKPRDPNQAVLAAKKNAAGQHRDKKRELKAGQDKHKSKFYEALSATDRKAILADFREWTGGFGPEETTEREIKRYVQSSLSSKYDEAEALKFLCSEHDSITEEIQIAEGWHNHKGGTQLFTADMSEIDSHMKTDKSMKLKCPACKKPIDLKSFTAKRDREGDITEWTMTHDCGAKLKIWND